MIQSQQTGLESYLRKQWAGPTRISALLCLKATVLSDVTARIEIFMNDRLGYKLLPRWAEGPISASIDRLVGSCSFINCLICITGLSLLRRTSLLSSSVIYQSPG